MPGERIAIVSADPARTLAEMPPVVAALQKQIDLDFGRSGAQAELIARAPAAKPPPGDRDAHGHGASRSPRDGRTSLRHPDAPVGGRVPVTGT